MDKKIIHVVNLDSSAVGDWDLLQFVLYEDKTVDVVLIQDGIRRELNIKFRFLFNAIIDLFSKLQEWL